MSELLNWNNTVVPQRRPESGCIPTGYEWLIRYMRIQGVDLTKFQEEFDLGRNNNNFDSVAAKIMSRYPTINIHRQGERDFPKGVDKVARIKSLVEKQIPCLISLTLQKDSWHIMPVVYVDDTTMEMIHDGIRGVNCIWKLGIKEIVWKHDNLQGGKDISWIDSVPSIVSSASDVS